MDEDFIFSVQGWISNDNLFSCCLPLASQWHSKSQIHIKSAGQEERRGIKPCSYRFTPNCFLISLHSICNQRSQINIQLGRCAMGAICPDAKNENNASLQCGDLPDLTAGTMLNLQFHNCHVITAPLAARRVCYKLTAPYPPQ